MIIIRREKKKNPKSNRLQYAYLCDDNIWRFLENLADISKITGKTRQEKINIIRVRIQTKGMSHKSILEPIKPRKGVRTGLKPGGISAGTWEGLTRKNRAGSLDNIRNIAGGLV